MKFGPVSIHIQFDYYDRIYILNCVYFEWDDIPVMRGIPDPECDLEKIYSSISRWTGLIGAVIFITSSIMQRGPVAEKICKLLEVDGNFDYVHDRYWQNAT